MTTTARDTIYRALRMLGVSDPEETPSSAQAEFGLLALNGMRKSWKAQGVDTGATDWTLDSVTDLEIDPQHWTGMCALLTVALSPEYPNSPVPAGTVAMAVSGWTGLQAAYTDLSPDRDLKCDRALLGRRRGWPPYTGVP